MTIADLENEIVVLKKSLLEKDKLIEELKFENERLREQLNNFIRHRFGQCSEKKLPQDQQDLDIPSQDELEFENISYQRRKRQKRQDKLSPDLPRQKVYYALPEEILICQCGCGCKLEKIGEEVTEQLVTIPEKVYVRQHIRFKYGGCQYDSTILTAPMLAQPIAKGLASPEFIAHTAVSKYEDHLPLYRQEQRSKRYGVPMARQTLCDWLLQGAKWGQLVVARMKEIALQAPMFNTDDTPTPVLAPGTGKTKTGRLWVYAGHGGNATPYIIYEYTENRKNEGPVNFFKDYTGYIQADACPAYDAVFASKDQNKKRPIEIGCWMHARRGFYQVARNTEKRGLAYDAVQYIRVLYAVEKIARDKQLTYEQRYEIRQEKSVPVLNEFKSWLDEKSGLVLPRSALGESITYALNQWKALYRYTENGMLTIDNGYAERLMKPTVLGKKNFLFFGSDGGGEMAATYYSLIQSALLHGLNTEEYLTDIFIRLPAMLYRSIDELLPHNWRPCSPYNLGKPIIVAELLAQFPQIINSS